MVKFWGDALNFVTVELAQSDVHAAMLGIGLLHKLTPVVAFTRIRLYGLPWKPPILGIGGCVVHGRVRQRSRKGG
jgi:hypothetical protein